MTDKRRGLEINLLPAEIVEKRRRERQMIYIVASGILVLAILAIFFAVNLARISSAKATLTKLKQENQRYSQAINKVKDYEQKKKMVESKEKLILSLDEAKIHWARFLNDISLVIPDDVWLTSLEANPQGVTFKGLALDSGQPHQGYKLIAKWLIHLGEINDLTDISLQSSSKSSKSSSSGKLNFETKASFASAKQENSASAVPAPPSSGGSQ
jgi:type IV pilus assembly protein PilN